MTELMKAGLWTTVEPRLSEATLQVLAELNFVEMTPVQASTLPLFLKHTDVVVEVIAIHFSYLTLPGSYWFWENPRICCAYPGKTEEN